jgi:hypothetical protein
MSYEIADERGNLLGQFASGGGYSDFIRAINAKKYPAVASLITHGASEHVSDVESELADFIAGQSDEDLKSTASAMLALVGGRDLILVADGTSEDDAQRKRAAHRAYQDSAHARDVRKDKKRSL